MVKKSLNFLYRRCRKKYILIWLTLFTVVWYLFHSASLLAINRSNFYIPPRLELVEEFENYLKNQEGDNAALIDAIENIKRNTISSIPLPKILHEICQFSRSELDAFPNCENKLNWMNEGWKTHECYANNGVDGSFCSFTIYLSEIEDYCPRLHWRKKPLKLNVTRKLAEFRSNLNDLFDAMNDSLVNYDFIKSRISRMWPKWISSFAYLESNWPNMLKNRKKLAILLHLGFLTKEAGFKFGQKANAGGPLGELVQWSDLIAALYMLGHELQISSETSSFKQHINRYISQFPCPDESVGKLDLLFTDIVGLRYIQRKFGGFYSKNKCILRVLDSFGSHAEFNVPSYFKKHRKELGGGPNPWGGNLLELQQFMTMYPHTDDNTFLGFVVEKYETRSDKEDSRRENATLVYGKEIYMWKNAETLLTKVSQLSQLHATVADVKDLSNYTVINHGLLSGIEFQSLLRSIKIFLGLGFPIEGPAPLEAIANGVVFINPEFKPPKSRRTYQFFRDKPTLRELTSQNPYVEHFIGKPYVLTLDINDSTALEDAILKALSSELKPFIPFEFTTTGMLQRVNVLVNKQIFCSNSVHQPFPPLSALQVVLGKDGVSCQRTCFERGLRCERSFFKFINNASIIAKFNHCVNLNHEANPLAPFSCVLQSDPMLFSCASASKDESVERICPCRDYIKEQVALCSSCL